MPIFELNFICSTTQTELGRVSILRLIDDAKKYSKYMIFYF